PTSQPRAASYHSRKGAGTAYKISPITDQVRIPILPHNDRVWLSAGVSSSKPLITKGLIHSLYKGWVELPVSQAQPALSFLHQNAPGKVPPSSNKFWPVM